MLTYKCSQDHLELFFCAIRGCSGWCPNPTCAQFVSAYRRLLVRHEIIATNGNAESMDSTNILTLSSGSGKKKCIDRYDPAVYNVMDNVRFCKKYGLDEIGCCSENDEFMDEFLVFHWQFSNSLSAFSKNCIANIAGWVVKKIVDEKRPLIRCETCRNALFQDSQSVAEFSDNNLIQIKTRGGLIFPSKCVVTICQRAENVIRHNLNRNKGAPFRELNAEAVLCAKILQDIFQPPFNLFPSLNEHIFDNAIENLSSHVFTLAKQICKCYIKLRMFIVTNSASDAAIGVKLRHHITRQIIWKSQ